jgi:hypothetical protein
MGMLSRYLDYVKKFYLEEFLIKPNIRQNKHRVIRKNNTILVVAHPRGGSNWLGEVLLQMPHAVLIDEPFWRGFYRSIGKLPERHKGKIKALSGLGFYYDQHIPPQVDWPEAKIIVESILKGAVSNFDLWDKNNYRDIKSGEIYLIKLCYGHLLFPWLHQNFNLRSIVMHRHPCAVVSSQLQFMAFSKIQQNPSGKIPGFPYNDIYKKYVPVFDIVKSKEEYLAAIWSIKTKYLLDNPLGENDSLSIYYEHLLMSYRETVEKIGGFLHMDASCLNTGIQRKASTSTPSKNHLLEGQQQLEKWRNHLSESQISKIMNIVRNFNIELYDYDLMPKV